MKLSATFHFLTATAAMLAMTGPAWAQSAHSPQPGDVIRVERLGKSGAVQGRLIHLASDSLILASGDTVASRVAVARADVTNVWVSVGKRRQTWKGAAIGLGAGAGVGALISAASYEPCEATGFMSCFMAPESAGQAALWGAAAGGVIGVVLGGVAGFATKSDVWQPIGVPTSVGLIPSRHGRVVLSLRMTM